MKSVLITGATGALGQAVVSRLKIDCKYRVIPVSRSCNDVHGLRFDICNQQQLFLAISKAKPDLIIHLAATFSFDFDESYAVNVMASRHLLDIVQKADFRARILLVGSAAEYGAVRPEENPIKENHILNPVSVYGLTKSWQTQLAGIYAGQDMDVVIARVFNLKGPGLSEQLFIGRLQKQINEVLSGSKSFIELGNLTATRDYISTHQAAGQIMAIAENGKSGHVYNVASGIPITVRELLTQYLTLNNLDISIVRESPELTNRVGYDVPVIYADTTKTMQLIKYDGTCVEN